MKIGVFTLAYRDVSFPTFCGMVGLASLAAGPLRPGDPDFPAMGVTFEYFFRRGFSASHNAAKLLEVALAWPEPVDLALFVEADIAFYPRHVARAVESYNAIPWTPPMKPPIIGAVYPASGEPDVIVGGAQPQGGRHYLDWYTDEVQRGARVRAQTLGFGFILVPMQLFRERAAAGLPLAPESSGAVYEGGDVLLCRWAREHGYPLYADFGLDVGHMYAEPRTLKEMIG